ncbi:MAG: hypothetical protein KJ566_00680 [Nanoarchaeota archaeon]|nr:hypothetical protein [Nanoarchaeota archaeon]
MKKRGQVWVETMIYTLVAFALIAAVLFFVKPKVEEIRDQALIEQSLEVMKYFDSTILELGQSVSGNKREIEVGIKKGTLLIDGENEKIVFEMKSKYEYSEPGEIISEGSLNVSTEKIGDENKITISKNYSNYNLTFNSADESKLISSSSTPYTIFVSNKGGSPIIIDFEIE